MQAGAQNAFLCDCSQCSRVPSVVRHSKTKLEVVITVRNIPHSVTLMYSSDPMLLSVAMT